MQIDSTLITTALWFVTGLGLGLTIGLIGLKRVMDDHLKTLDKTLMLAASLSAARELASEHDLEAELVTRMNQKMEEAADRREKLEP